MAVPRLLLAVSPFSLVSLSLSLLALSALLPRVRANFRLAVSIWCAVAILGCAAVVLRWLVARHGRGLRYDFRLAPVHYVQLLMHSSIYCYWGYYWRPVYDYIPLIAAQIVFAYVVEMLACWSRRDQYLLGFGPFPIVLSTNLFLWFRDDWFFLQLAVIGAAILCKEFVKWTRDGRRTHIFNPSAIALFVTSVLLIAFRGTHLTMGQEVSLTLQWPPYIYLELFVLGLIVQSLFSVTLVTLASAATLVALNLIYTGVTGTYHFIDTAIPVPLFPGLHLLVTDPATSPRSAVGKAWFGFLYGLSVFCAYECLAWLNAPQFYDKLLCVPLLNLAVRRIDAIVARVTLPSWLHADAWNTRRENLAHMAAWSLLFLVMLSSNLIGVGHPGKSAAFWKTACSEGRRKACESYVYLLGRNCQGNSARACFELGQVLAVGLAVPRDTVAAGKSLWRACELGLRESCRSMTLLVHEKGEAAWLQACERGDGGSCFILAGLLRAGNGVAPDHYRAVEFLRRACENSWWRGCDALGHSYLRGDGAPADVAHAIASFDRACAGNYAPSCAAAGLLYTRESGGLSDRAQQRFQRACAYGVAEACDPKEILGRFAHFQSSGFPPAPYVQ